MTDKEKRVVFGIIGIMLIILIVVVIVKTNGKKEEIPTAGNAAVQNKTGEEFSTTLEDGTKLNTSQEMKDTKTYNGLEISNIQLTQKDGTSVLLADVKNLSGSKHEAEIVKISILDGAGNVICSISPVIGEIENGKTIKLNAMVSADVANAKDFKIEQK